MRLPLTASSTSLIALLTIAFLSLPAVAGDRQDAEEIVTEATGTFQDFVSDPDMTWMREHMHEAKAVLVIPTLAKAGFIFGGSGGTGALLARDSESGAWSDPAFYTMGSATFGLQAGVQAAQVVLMIMTDKGMNAVLSNKFQLGADASVAAGPVGAGAQAATADVLQFSRAKGVFGGLTVEGSVIAIRGSLNNAYYGKTVLPPDILVRHNVHNPQARGLVEAVSKAGK